jgi:hypothetical protein
VKDRRNLIGVSPGEFVLETEVCDEWCDFLLESDSLKSAWAEIVAGFVADQNSPSKKDDIIEAMIFVWYEMPESALARQLNRLVTFGEFKMREDACTYLYRNSKPEEIANGWGMFDE